MKTCVKKSLILPVLIGLGSVLAGEVEAQTFNVLHRLAPGEGARPSTAPVISGNRLYGATLALDFDYGTIFAVNTDGTGFTNLHSFNGTTDGFEVDAPLCISGDVLYGTGRKGGTSGTGTVFKLHTDGSGFTVLHAFTPVVDNQGHLVANDDGASPVGLVLSGDTLYGTATEGGNSDSGTIFAINTDGTSFRTLHKFNGTDGGVPMTALTVSGNRLYGSAGTVFAINADGTDFRVLHPFDGQSPATTLVLSGNSLYGAAGFDYELGFGTIFTLNIDGTGFKILHSFTEGFTNSVDEYPMSVGLGATSLILSRNSLYGTTAEGGRNGSGTVFRLNTDGSGFSSLHDFPLLSRPYSTNTEGAIPIGLILSDSTLYGTTINGGLYSGMFGKYTFGSGTLFSLSLPPLLTITPTAANQVLTWPTNFTGYTLQTATNLSAPVWTTNLPAAVVVNGQYTVTNPISGTQQFFRLVQ
jgi:uncharacterized repeat protein (TIGR03803 family)